MLKTSILLKLDAKLATVSIDALQRRNALRSDDWKAIALAVAEADENDDISTIVLRGTKEHFSAGADIYELMDVLRNENDANIYFAIMEAAMSAIETARKPVIAVIEGHCFGAAVALALACDMRVVSSNASFAITPAKLGIIYPYKDTGRVVRSIGAGQARRLIYSGEAINADEALAIGLIEKVIDGKYFDAHVSEFLAGLAQRSSWTIRCTKILIRETSTGENADSSSYSSLLRETLSSEELWEGLGAFKEKRNPTFS